MNISKPFLGCLLIALFTGCGGSDSRPDGTYNYVTGSDTGSIGCSDDFMAFLSAESGGGATDLQITLSPTGDDSIDFTYNNFSTILSPSSDDKTWVGTATGTLTLSGCQITETLSIGVTDIGNDKINIDFLDEWNNVPLTDECPFSNDSCLNIISADAQKI